MIQIVKNKEGTKIKEFICDKKEDMADIDLRVCEMGTTCFVIEEDIIYILNSKKEWVVATKENVTSLNGMTGAVTIPEGLSEDAKNALIDCFRHVAWINSDGTQYVNALISALYELQSITAVYTQSGTVYDTDSLDDLKADLVVTANYKGGTTETVTAYTLSGALEEGTSTITVSYEGLTDTFNVTVSHLTILYPLENGTHVFTDKKNRTVTVSNHNHIEFTDPSPTTSGSDTGAYIDLRNVSRNDATGTSKNNFNRSDVWFTIPAGANYRMEVKNISSNHLVSTRNFALYFVNGTTQKIHGGNITDNTGSTVTGTASSDIAVTCLAAYISYDYGYLECDVELYVNDVRWV